MQRTRCWLAVIPFILLACGDDADETGGAGSGGSGGSAQGGSAQGGSAQGGSAQGGSAQGGSGGSGEGGSPQGGGSGGSAQGGAGGTGGGSGGGVPGSGCPARLDPVEPAGDAIVVRDGTPGSCTETALQDAVTAINASSGGGTITFDCGGAHTIALTASLRVENNLIVDGEGLITISGSNTVRVFDLDHYTELVVQRLTIADGRTEESGAGIHHPWYGTLKAIDVDFVNNHCTSEAGEIGGGAVFAGGLSEAIFSGCTFVGNSASNGGGLLNRGSTLTVVDTLFSDNEATSHADSGQFGNGGGLYIDGMNYDTPGDFNMCGTVFDGNNAKQHGSAAFMYFYEGSTSYIDRCSFLSNDFDGSPSGGAGGVYHQAVHLELTNSTIAGNRSDKHAAGLFIGSGSTARITNCTIANNQVPEVGAGLFAGNSPVELLNCTFANNDADYAPAIFKGDEGSVELTNTLFFNNTSPNQYSAVACHETFQDGGGNVQWPSKKASGSDDNPCAASVLFGDPLLGDLADNGGPTKTMALGSGSAAIDVGSGCPDTDQRGLPRVGACDSGAFEAQ